MPRSKSPTAISIGLRLSTFAGSSQKTNQQQCLYIRTSIWKPLELFEIYFVLWKERVWLQWHRHLRGECRLRSKGDMASVNNRCMYHYSPLCRSFRIDGCLNGRWFQNKKKKANSAYKSMCLGATPVSYEGCAEKSGLAAVSYKISVSTAHTNFVSLPRREAGRGNGKSIYK